MKLNSNTVSLNREHYNELEVIIKKISSQYEMNDISKVDISLESDKGIITFKKAVTDELRDYISPYTKSEGIDVFPTSKFLNVVEDLKEFSRLAAESGGMVPEHFVGKLNSLYKMALELFSEMSKELQGESFSEYSKIPKEDFPVSAEKYK